jgi:hypothetical protein
MLLDFPLIQLFRSIISKLFRQGFFELITVEPAIWQRYIITNMSKVLSKNNRLRTTNIIRQNSCSFEVDKINRLFPKVLYQSLHIEGNHTHSMHTGIESSVFSVSSDILPVKKTLIESIFLR